MPHSIIGIGLLVVMSFAIFNGVFMLVAPSRHRRFLELLRGVHCPAERVSEQLDLGRRLAGIGIAAMAAYVVWNVIRAARAAQHDLERSAHGIAGGSASLIIGCCSLFCGSVIVAKPDWVVQWSRQHQPRALDITNHTLSMWKRGAIFLGVVLVSGGLYTLWNVLRNF